MPLKHTISSNIYNVKTFMHFVVKREAAVHFLVYYVLNDSDFFSTINGCIPTVLVHGNAHTPTDKRLCFTDLNS